jgi:hypothetical protein
MSTSPSITNGQQASASVLNQSFTGLQTQGNAILDLLTQIQLTTLVDYSHRMTALASKQQLAARVQAADIVGLFVVSDFDDIDQGLSTATIRIDTSAATLRERRVPSTALVTSTSFSSSSGSVAALNQDQTLLSVTSSTTPIGTFTLQLQEAVGLSVLSIDLVSMAAAPTISIQVSPDGLVYTPASSISLNGSSLTAWFPASNVVFIQVILTPAQPDNLSGNTYTFGITDFSATTVSYNLVSDIYFRQLQINPTSQNLLFRAQGTPGIIYHLLFSNGDGYLAVTDGSIVSIPGVTPVNQTAIAINAQGVLQSEPISVNLYVNSMTVTNTTTGVEIPVVFGLSATDPHVGLLTKPIAGVDGSTITILPIPASTTDVYEVSYLFGPPVVFVTLLVHLSTADSTQTPVFQAASLEEI